MSAMKLFSDRGCPYAQRVLAVLAHLGRTAEIVEADYGTAPEGLLDWSETGRVPLLVHGSLVLGESAVICLYLAELFQWDAALPAESAARARHRELMAVFDRELASGVPRNEPLGPRGSEVLDALDLLVAELAPEPGLLAFHLAPFWQRAQWWHPGGTLHSAVLQRPDLAGWLDRVAAIPAVRATAPLPEVARAQHRAAASTFDS